MPRVPQNIAQGFYVDESIPVSSQQCVNFYPHIPQTKTITDGSLIGTSGIDLACAIDGVCQASHTMDGIPYFVGGGEFTFIYYTEDTFGNRTYFKQVWAPPNLGATSTIMMADNGYQLAVLLTNSSTVLNLYIYDVVNGLIQISDVDFDGPANFVVYHDGYFVFSKANSNKFFISDLRDGRFYDALDFASAESDPDNIVALGVLNGLLYIFGTRTYEQWQNTGVGAGFPYTKATSGSQQKGCSAPLSLTEFNGSLVWIGAGANEKPAVWATSGSARESWHCCR